MVALRKVFSFSDVMVALREVFSFKSTKRSNLAVTVCTGLVRVLENLESPGILFWHFPGLENKGKWPLVLESPGNLLISTKKYEVYGRQ